MKHFKIISFFLILIIFSSCSIHDEQLEELLTEINQRKILNVDISGWHTIHSFENNQYITYKIDKMKNDTMIDLSFKYHFENDKFDIEYLLKLFPAELGNYFYSLTMKYDTLYFYKIDSPSAIEKEFIVGEYYYLYEFNQLTERQKLYFEKHRDSLIKVRGNNLPELPEMRN